MTLNPNTLQAFLALSEALKNIPETVLIEAKQYNPWFDETNVKKAAMAWHLELNESNIVTWIEKYARNETQKKVAIIMAGNIPFVGLHDLLCVLVVDCVPYCKLSSDDRVLMNYCIDILNKHLTLKIEIIEKVKNADAVIATGSNNSAKIFEAYFKQFPHIIRRNRTSVAVLTGHETSQELNLLGSDIFNYYGLGCRNVSKIYVSKGYDFTGFFEAIFDFGDIVNHHKYANNYDYNKAIYLLGMEKFLDNNFLIVREDNISLHSPLAVIFYSYYETIQELKNSISAHDQEIQCVVAKINLNINNQVGFGKTQEPKLWDYADGIDTLEFLGKL